MKKFKIVVEGRCNFKRFPEQDKNTKKILTQDIEAYNLSHALSFCLNAAKEFKIEVKRLEITEIYV